MAAQAVHIEYPIGISPDLVAKYRPVVERLAGILGVNKLHHFGITVDEKHKKATFVESSGCWVSPVEQGLETLFFEREENRRLYSRPHFCFAVQEVAPFLSRGYKVDSQVNGPLGPATFITVDGESVELLVPLAE